VLHGALGVVAAPAELERAERHVGLPGGGQRHLSCCLLLSTNLTGACAILCMHRILVPGSVLRKARQGTDILRGHSPCLELKLSPGLGTDCCTLPACSVVLNLNPGLGLLFPGPPCRLAAQVLLPLGPNLQSPRNVSRSGTPSNSFSSSSKNASQLLMPPTGRRHNAASPSCGGPALRTCYKGLCILIQCKGPSLSLQKLPTPSLNPLPLRKTSTNTITTTGVQLHLPQAVLPEG